MMHRRCRVPLALVQSLLLLSLILKLSRAHARLASNFMAHDLPNILKLYLRNRLLDHLNPPPLSSSLSGSQISTPLSLSSEVGLTTKACTEEERLPRCHSILS